MLTSMRSWVVWKTVSILISIWLWTCFRWLSVLLFPAVVLQLSRLELWLAGRAENVRRMWESCFWKREIYSIPNHVSSSKRKIYFCTGKVPLGYKRGDVVENTGTWLFCPIRLPKPFFYFGTEIFCFGKKFSTSKFWILFFQNFPLHVLFTDCSKNKGL